MSWHETSAWTWCSGKTWRERVEREVGGGIGRGKTCKLKAVSFQCMTKFTKKKKKKKFWIGSIKLVVSFLIFYPEITVKTTFFLVYTTKYMCVVSLHNMRFIPPSWPYQLCFSAQRYPLAIANPLCMLFVSWIQPQALWILGPRG